MVCLAWAKAAISSGITSVFTTSFTAGKTFVSIQSASRSRAGITSSTSIVPRLAITGRSWAPMRSFSSPICILTCSKWPAVESA